MAEWIEQRQVALLAFAEALIALAVIIAREVGVDVTAEQTAGVMGAFAALLGLFTRPRTVSVQALDRLPKP